MAKVRREDDWDRDLTLAWHTAKLMRLRRVPSLQSLKHGSVGRMPRKQTVRQQVTTVHMLAQIYGGRVTTQREREAERLAG